MFVVIKSYLSYNGYMNSKSQFLTKNCLFGSKKVDDWQMSDFMLNLSDFFYFFKYFLFKISRKIEEMS